VELRRYTRAPFAQPIEFSPKGEGARVAGTSRDLSLGGMFVHTAAPATFGAEVVVHLTLPSEPKELSLPGVVRWTRPDGMGVQFGLLGARETHAITEVVRQVEAR
jgi:type IV pilus assembly protein PilZ